MSAYLRYPHIHGELVVFTAADDVWLAPVAGGRAWRLTDDATPVTTPWFSPDGANVAWSSTRDGHTEVMVVAVDGGEAERLTYLGTEMTRVLGWSTDGRVLFASDHAEGPRRRFVVHAVDLDGAVERLDYGAASGLAVHPGGAVALTTPWSRPPAQWKRYRGGTAPRLWLDRAGDGRWTRLLTDVEAGLVSPNWIGDQLVIASDQGARFPDRADEQANLWRLDALGTGEPVQLTHHTGEHGYVRDPTSDGERIVYHARGVVYRLDSLDAEPVALDISLGAATRGRRRHQLDPEQNLRAVRPDHGANASLVSWHGKTFYLAHREGPARAVVADSGVRTREPQFLGRTGKAVLVSDADGADRLEIHDLDGDAEPQLVADGALGRVLHLAASPDGTKVAAIAHDGTVSLVDPATATVRRIGSARHGEATGLTFSPDSRYLVWSQPTMVEMAHSQLVGLDLSELPDDGPVEPVALTSGRFSEYSPSFSRDGKYLLFLSARTFDPMYDGHNFDIAFTGVLRPYLIPLAADEPAPFGPSAEGWRISPDEPASPATDPGAEPDAAADESNAGASGADADAAPRSPDWDVDGFEERLVAFPVPSGKYRSLRAAADAVVWIHEASDRGAIGSGRAGVADEPADVLERYSFVKRKVEVLLDRVDAVEVSGDGSRLVCREKATVTVRPVERPLKPDDPELVTVDLRRLRFDVDPVAERRQKFDETVRLLAENFWRADMDGVDWPAAAERYLPALERVVTDDDLDDLFWEVIGELNTSHCYVQPKQPRADQSRRLGLLGADLAPGADGWRIERILPGESSEPEARSPLRAAGVGAAVGDEIVAVGGIPVDRRFGPAPLLVGCAEAPVELTLRRDGTDRRVVVVPLKTEGALRYQDWVRGRRAYVDEHSGGRLGYVHIPDMMGVGWAQLHRDLRRAVRQEGLVVDVRYNAGGHLSQLVIERLRRRPIGWVTGRDLAEQETYPADSPRGPVVFVANEMAGSDGDIVNAAAQAFELGPVIGTRTWGGVVGIDGRHDLVDSTGVTQPKYAFWLDGYGWGVENHGVDPDIEVEIAPDELLREGEQDRQLDRAIAEALERLAVTPAAQGPELPDPKVRPLGD